MQPPTARPRGATPARSPAAAAPSARRGGRPPKDDAIRDQPVVSVRLEPELLARLDRIVARRNRELALQGATTSRGGVLTHMVREFCDREESAHPEQGGGT